MSDALANYARAAETYRGLVAGYRREVGLAADHLSRCLPDWAVVMTPEDPRHARPQVSGAGEIQLAAHWFDAAAVITAARLRELLAGLRAAWDELGDCYEGVGPDGRGVLESPWAIHAAAVEPPRPWGS